MKHMHLWIYLIFKSRGHTTLTKTSQDLPNRNTRNSVVFLPCFISSYSHPSANAFLAVQITLVSHMTIMWHFNFSYKMYTRVVFNGADQPQRLVIENDDSVFVDEGQILGELLLSTICGSDIHTVKGMRNEPVPRYVRARTPVCVTLSWSTRCI